MNISDVESASMLYKVKFIITITLEISALFGSLLIIVFFVKHRAELKKMQNRSLLILFTINLVELLTDMPMSIDFYYFQSVRFAIIDYCTWWTFTLFGFAVIGEFLMAVISIQRHFFIFQAHVFQNRRKRYIFYYLPLILSIIYPILFYIYSVFLVTCDGSQWDFTLPVCGFANCYFLYDATLTLFDYVFNNTVPLVVIFIANVILVIRVVKQKRHRQQRFVWKKHRRMTIQLVCISSLYLIAWAPVIIDTLILNISPSPSLIQFHINYVSEFPNLACYGLPWIYAGLLSEFKKWMWKRISPARIAAHTVQPV